MKRLLILLLSLLTLLSISGCGKSEAILNLEDQISSLGEITLDDGKSIINISTMYNALTESERKQVENYDEYKKAKVEYVQLCIEEIGTVTLKSREIIVRAQSALKLLTDEEKAEIKGVENVSKAVTSYNKIREQTINATNSKLNKLVKEHDEFSGTSTYRPKAMPKYINTRCYILPSIDMTQIENVDMTLLMISYVYTGDEWVFFDRITIKADDETFTKEFTGSFRPTRDNAYGDVWEYLTISASDDEIAMLEAIANSKKTMVRFIGDDKYHTYTVSSSDKTAIKQVLEAYEGLRLAKEEPLVAE